jgi:hypothetical protein
MTQNVPGLSARFVRLTSVGLQSGPSGPGWCKHHDGDSHYDVRHQLTKFGLIQSTLTPPLAMAPLVSVRGFSQGEQVRALALEPWAFAPEN